MIVQLENQILESMRTLIQDGESLTTGDYVGTNPSVFLEFAETNGFELNDVIQVYNKNENDLNELWIEANE